MKKNRSGLVIMASGLGKRFGSNKLIADFNGRPLIEWGIDAGIAAFDKVVVVTRHTEVADICRRKGVSVILHDLPYRSDTIRLGVEAMDDDICCCGFMPGDQPLISSATLKHLIATWRENPEHICRPCYMDTPGAPAVFPRKYFDELCRLPEGKGGNVIIKAHPDLIKDVPVDNELELIDTDTPEELARLSQAALS